MQAAYLRGPIGVAEIAAAARHVGASDAGGGPLADHEARGVGFGEVAGGRVGDIQREDRGTTRAQTANHPRVPRVTVEQVAGAGHGIDEEVVPVLRVRVVHIGGRGVNRLHDGARHVRQHFQAVVAGGDEVAVRIVGAGAEPVQQPVVPADIHHVHAGLRGGNVLGVGLRAETRLGIGGRGIQPVAPGPRIGRHRRTHPGRARVDDVAQYVRARAVQAGAGGVDFVAAVAAQVVQTVGAVGRGIPRIDGRLLATAGTGGQVAPLERNPRTAVPRQDDPARRSLGGDRARDPGGAAGLARRHARERARGVPVGRRGNDHIAEAIESKTARRDTAGPTARVVVGEEGLRAGLELGGLLLVGARGAGGSGGRIRLEAQDLVDVGVATGGAGETEQEIRGQRAVRCRDALPRDDRLIGTTVEAVGETQQTVLGDLQLIEDRRRRTAGRGGFVGDLGARGEDNVSVRNRCVVVQRYGVAGDLDRFAVVCRVPHHTGRASGAHRALHPRGTLTAGVVSGVVGVQP